MRATISKYLTARIFYILWCFSMRILGIWITEDTSAPAVIWGFSEEPKYALKSTFELDNYQPNCFRRNKHLLVF